MQSIYTAKLGLQVQQQRLDTIAANIANISTTSYKGQSLTFKDALYTRMIDPSDTKSTENLQQGSGALAATAYRDFSAGIQTETGEPLDFCIEGDGFFTVQDGSGDTVYTRSGAFAVSVEESGRYLVTANGYYVLDSNGNRIELPEDMSSLSVAPDGTLDLGDGASVKLGLATFTNKDGLLLLGKGCYAKTEASGDAKESSAAISQGYLEGSNVNISMEFAKLIRTQRAYSLAGKVLTTWDEMASETNNIR